MKEYLPPYYLGHILHALSELGFDTPALLKEFNLNTSNQSVLDLKVSTNQFDAMLTRVLSDSSHQHLGMLVGKRLNIAHHGTFGLGILNCSTVKQVIEFVQKYIQIRIPFIHISFIIKDEKVVVLAKDTHWHGALHRMVIEAVTCAVFNLFEELKKKCPEIRIDGLFFDFPEPSESHVYEVLPARAINFNHAYCGISFDKRLLQATIEHVDNLSYLQAEQACEQELRKHLQYESLSGKVREQLMKEQTRRFDLNSMAEILGMSSRSLHRHLKNEGSSFKILLDEHYAALSKEYLLVYGYGVSQTAASLGFMDVANFRRAFKRWHKMTPSELIRSAQK